ncbi:unnamed protein product, partial [Pylaiella littoralis]
MTLLPPERVYCSGVGAAAAAAGGRRGSASVVEAPQLVKMFRTVGSFCWPRFEVVGSPNIDLGNIGHTTSRRGRRHFEVRLQSLCDMAVPVGMVAISPELEVVTEVGDGDGHGRGGGGVVKYKALVPRRSAALRRNNSETTPGRADGGSYSGCGSSGCASSGGGGNGGSGGFTSSARKELRGGATAAAVDGECTDMLWVPARGEATLVIQLRLSRRRQSWAGAQAFRICLANLADPSAEELVVNVIARVVTQLVRMVGLDEPPPSPISHRVYSPGTPTAPSSYMGSSSSSIWRRARSSSIEAFGSFGASEGGSLRLAPLAIPPLRGAAGRCAKSFQVKNVSGDTVSVTLRVTPTPEVAEVLSFGASLQQQDSSTGVYATAGADGRPS